MAKITAADLFDTVEVDLWGATFQVREATRTVQAKVSDSQEALQALDDTDTEAIATAIIGLLDLLLEPLGDEKGQKVKAKTMLERKWKADELGVDRLLALSDQIQSEIEARGRPTSPSQNGG